MGFPVSTGLGVKYFPEGLCSDCVGAAGIEIEPGVVSGGEVGLLLVAPGEQPLIKDIIDIIAIIIEYFFTFHLTNNVPTIQ